MSITETKDLFTVCVPTKEAGYEFNGKIWTKSSKSMVWRDDVMYCANRDTKMQTLDDAVEFMHDSDGANGSDDYQQTSTLIATVADGKALRAQCLRAGNERTQALSRQ